MFLGEIPRTSTDPQIHRLLTAFHAMDFRSPELLDSAGELLGLLAGIKPAVLFSPANDEVCADWTRTVNRHGFPLIVSQHIIADPQQILARVEHEPTFAQWAGWNREQTVEENLHRHMTSEVYDNIDGLVLGYPECAVRHMDRYLRLILRDIEPLGGFDTAAWSDEDQRIYRSLCERLESTDESLDGTALDYNRVYAEVYTSDECRDLYRRHVPQATDADYALLANRRSAVIPGPLGTTVYHFMVHADDLNHVDCRALRARVHDGFTRHGFGSFL